MRETLEINEKQGLKDDEIFIFVVYGFAPEFCDGLAFRTDKSCKPRKMKEVYCPHCGRVFETVGINTKIEVYRCSKKTDLTCHKFRHCKICHGIVGVKFA